METLLTHFPLFTVYVLAWQTFSHLTQTQRPQHCQDPICRIWEASILENLQRAHPDRTSCCGAVWGLCFGCELISRPNVLVVCDRWLEDSCTGSSP